MKVFFMVFVCFYVVFSHTVCGFTLTRSWPFPAWRWTNRLLELTGRMWKKRKGCVKGLVDLVFEILNSHFSL